MKAHIGVDAASGLVHTVVGTSANVNDLNVAGQLLHGQEHAAFGDAGYQGVHKRPEAAEPAWHVAMRHADLLMAPYCASAHTAAWTGNIGWVAFRACVGWASGTRMNASHKPQRIGIGRGATLNRRGQPPVGPQSSKYPFIARPEVVGEAPSASNRARRYAGFSSLSLQRQQFLVHCC
jgi:hypothetical protein